MDMLNVEKRDLAVKAKKLRREGKVPASVCGGLLKESISLTANLADAQKLAAENHIGSRLTLNLDGKKIPVQLKEKAVGIINTKDILSLGFQALAADQKVNSIIHIVLENAEKTDCLIEQITTEIPYDALPADMIDTITLDVDGMKAGDAVTIADVKELQNDKINVQLPADEVIFKLVDKKHMGAPAEETEEDAAE